MTDYPDRLKTECDNWLCQSDWFTDHDLQGTKDYTSMIFETVTLEIVIKICWNYVTV